MAALRLNGTWVEVEDVLAASEKVRDDIDATGVGSTEWYDHKAQGEVRMSGRTVARISYNGRIEWMPVMV